MNDSHQINEDKSMEAEKNAALDKHLCETAELHSLILSVQEQIEDTHILQLIGLNLDLIELIRNDYQINNQPGATLLHCSYIKSCHILHYTRRMAEILNDLVKEEPQDYSI